jgi:predicted CoA-binding protein
VRALPSKSTNKNSHKPMPIEDDPKLKQILEDAKVIAVFGASTKPWRESNNISDFLIRKGYDVVPVNPRYQEVLGKKCYPDLPSIPLKIDIVDVFRNSDSVGEVVDQAIQAGAKTIWMQLGVINEAAAKKAEEAGLQVVMDHCIAVEHRRLIR